MTEIQEVMNRAKQAAKERQEMLTKEQDSDSLLLKEALRKNNIANSKKCPFGICDGTGLIYDKEKNGHYKCDCAKLEIKEQKLKFASIPEEFKDFKVGEFDTEIYTRVESRENAVFVKNIAIEYVKKFDKMQSLGKGLYFYSRLRGTGKTRLAASVGNAIIKTYLKSVRFITTSNLLNSIKSTFENSSSFVDTYTTLINDFKNIDILIIDDIGSERASEWVDEMFYNIINDRMTSKKVTIFTSNYSIEELPVDKRISNRIMKMAVPIAFPEESVRSILSKQENEEIIKILLDN